MALLQRETGGIKNEIEKKKRGGGGRFPAPLNFRLCFAQRGAGSSRGSAGDPQALFPCRRLESRVCSPPEAILPAKRLFVLPLLVAGRGLEGETQPSQVLQTLKKAEAGRQADVPDGGGREGGEEREENHHGCVF